VHPVPLAHTLLLSAKGRTRRGELAIVLEEILNHGFETPSARPRSPLPFAALPSASLLPAAPPTERARLFPDVRHERTRPFSNKAVTICSRGRPSPIRRFSSHLSVLSASSVVASCLERAVL